MKKLIIIATLLAVIIPTFLLADVTYLSQDEYKKLKKKERLQYWQQLQDQLAEYQKAKSQAIADKEKYKKEIEQLKQELQNTKNEYSQTYDNILKNLGVSPEDIGKIKDQINDFNQKYEQYNNMTDNELWAKRKQVNALIEEYENYAKKPQAKVPDYINEFSDLNNKIENLKKNLQNAKPKYYEDTYTVEKGDYLSKISGYEFIYNDPKKWGIIYRANRDKIKDPNLIYPNMVLKIPRGLPNTWKVYKGEFLWKIASYPEVYGNGAKWPLIYRANKDKIKDPNLIFPNQIFEIPRD